MWPMRNGWIRERCGVHKRGRRCAKKAPCRRERRTTGDTPVPTGNAGAVPAATTGTSATQAARVWRISYAPAMTSRKRGDTVFQSSTSTMNGKSDSEKAYLVPMRNGVRCKTNGGSASTGIALEKGGGLQDLQAMMPIDRQ